MKEYDARYGKEVFVVSVVNPSNSVMAVVDAETKLPLRIHFIQSSEYGMIIKDYDQIIFDEEPPAGLFDITIPEGAIVVNQDRAILGNNSGRQMCEEQTARGAGGYRAYTAFVR